jgi:hypothetical protein
MDYKEIGRAEMSPFVYGGEKADEHVPRWIGSFEGDMDEGEVGEKGVIMLDSKTFPAGTRVIVMVPECPSCTHQVEICNCGFDWKKWADEQYS